MKIRKAEAKDLDAILRLNKALFDYETIFNNEYNLDWTYSKVGQDYFKKMIKSGITLVAEVDDKVVGYVVVSVFNHSYRSENPISELENMYINEGFRRQGIGKELIKEAQRLAKEKGAKRMKVEAAAKNESAIKFYQSCGFEDFDVVLQTKLNLNHE